MQVTVRGGTGYTTPPARLGLAGGSLAALILAGRDLLSEALEVLRVEGGRGKRAAAGDSNDERERGAVIVFDGGLSRLGLGICFRGQV